MSRACRVERCGAVVAVLASVSTASVAQPAMPSPLDGLGQDIARAFAGPPLILYAAALVATPAMAYGGVDHAIRVAVQRHLVVRGYGDAAYYGGYVLPIVVAPAIYVAGLVDDDGETTGAGSAAVQALAVTAAATALLKVSTGRPFPVHGGDPRAPDRLDHPEYAREFSPFSLQWAWPSGHASASTAIAASLTAYYPESWAVPLVGYTVVFAIGAGMIVGDHHWASDVVAGALVGQGIGHCIGSSFRKRRRSDETSGVYVLPLVGAEQGIVVGGGF